ncbi:hypothetical protein BDB00DRAFT_562985 [Zychaea mexicana]|uniref:uncharacterized protein n=1 Tax=Zychaea mexicana TaxID=64656 RepID=UPI0022FF296B|nr:uncharacterized protein BDB00DRAFT_562985 [Zychaea mexicana]KAI9490222.1 hypothetical protein BDB00DRAFT_562985 [Zychaea mexicana]
MTVVPLPYEIAHCSSWDDDHEPEQLVASSPGNRIKRSDKIDDDADIGEPDALPSNNKVKGWQTPKCPTYPQDLIIRLLCGPARISKVQVLSHHYKIATKIDVYIGILKDPSSIQDDLDEHVSPEDDEEDEDDMVIEFTRLGYVSLDNNTRAQYRARELKSIKVNADGEYVRLVVRSCHRNRLNTYNQVGLLALNVLGQPLRHEAAGVTAIPSHMARYLHHPLDESSMLSSSTRRTSVSSSQSLSNRLSASGVLDIELQQWISALMHAEEEAARDESYQAAKVYKDISDKLSRFGKIVIDLELGKKQAVESKDYDEAEKIKADICEIKRSAEQLLEQANIHITRDGRVVPAGNSNGVIVGAEYEDDDEIDIIPESLRGPSYPSNESDDMIRHPEAVSKHHHDNENDTTLISHHDNINDDDNDYHRHHHSNPETTQQDRLYDEAIEKWTNFDAYITPPHNEGISQNDSTTHQSSPTSSLSTDAAEMLLPPHLTSYGGHNSNSLIGREMVVEDDNTDGGLEKPIDLQRVSMSDLMAPSLSASVARKHSLRGMTTEEQQQFFEHQVDEARIQQKLQQVPKKEPLDPECVPEPLIDAERANCRVPIRVFGEDIVTCVLSVKVKCREYGLKQIAESVKLACAFVENNELHRLDELVDDPHHTSLSDDSSSETSIGEDYEEDIRRTAMFTKAALMMVQEAVMDSRESIISMTIDIWKDVNAICEVVPHTLVFGLIERAFSGLLMRTNDTNTRIRQPASQLVLDLSEKFYERPYSLLSLYIAKPDRIIHNHKDARARIELVSSAVDYLRIIQQQQSAKKRNGDAVADIGIIPLNDLMAFVVTYLNHSHDDVRQAAVELVIDISEQVGFPSVSKYIDKDLRLSLAETVKKVAESREPAQDTSSSKPSSFGSNGTVAELRAFAAKASSPSEKKSSQATKKTGDNTKRRTAGTTTVTGAADKRGKADSRTTSTASKKTTTTSTANGTRTSAARSNTRGANTNTTSKASSKNTTTTTTTTSASRQEDPLLDDKNICIFCEESNPDFNEDTLISHYYDECPVLTSCPRCQIILEISTLSDHTFKDCAKRHLVKQCTRCKQAVPVEQWLQHTLKQTCSAVTDGETRCPLCMGSIDPVTDSQWKAHLLNGDGCPKNPRQVRRIKAAASAAPASKPAKADAPRSTARGAGSATKTPTSSLRRKK